MAEPTVVYAVAWVTAKSSTSVACDSTRARSAPQSGATSPRRRHGETFLKLPVFQSFSLTTFHHHFSK